MASNLKYGNSFDGYSKLDEFFKSLMFQKIMDMDLSRNERDVLLVIFRKTIHFEKWKDRIAMYWLSKACGVSLTTLRVTLERLENKSLIDIEKSTGGKSDSNKKYNEFSISNYLIESIYDKWENIKIDNNFYTDLELD